MQNKQKLDYIDALRGFAILLVIFAHTGQMFPLAYPSYLKSLIDFGPRGVQLFFIVSALTLFLSGTKRYQTDINPTLNFFIRRFFRIAPLYYLGILSYSIIESGTDIVTIGNVLRNLLFINDLYPDNSLVPGGWSISSEMLFYLFVPYLFTRLKSLNDAALFTAISLFVAILCKIMVEKINLNIDPEFEHQINFPYLFPFSIPVFGIGICFYFIIFKGDTLIKPIYLLGTSILLLVSIMYNSGVVFLYFQTMAFGVVAYALSKFEFSLLVNSITTYFGKVSYSMYMVHFVVIKMIHSTKVLHYFPLEGKPLIIEFAIKFSLIVTGTVLISSILYHLIEVPGQNIGKAIIKRLDSRSQIKSLIISSQ